MHIFEYFTHQGRRLRRLPTCPVGIRRRRIGVRLLHQAHCRAVSNLLLPTKMMFHDFPGNGNGVARKSLSFLARRWNARHAVPACSRLHIRINHREVHRDMLNVFFFGSSSLHFLVSDFSVRWAVCRFFEFHCISKKNMTRFDLSAAFSALLNRKLPCLDIGFHHNVRKCFGPTRKIILFRHS